MDPALDNIFSDWMCEVWEGIYWWDMGLQKKKETINRKYDMSKLSRYFETYSRIPR